MVEDQNLHVSSHKDGEEDYIEIHIGNVNCQLSIDDAKWLIFCIEDELKVISEG